MKGSIVTSSPTGTAVNPKYTPTEQRILRLLADGTAHCRHEVLRCLDDPQADFNTLNAHLVRIRRKLQLIGHDVVCCYRGRRFYHRHVVVLPADHAQ